MRRLAAGDHNLRSRRNSQSRVMCGYITPALNRVGQNFFSNDLSSSPFFHYLDNDSDDGDGASFLQTPFLREVSFSVMMILIACSTLLSFHTGDENYHFFRVRLSYLDVDTMCSFVIVTLTVKWLCAPDIYLTLFLSQCAQIPFRWRVQQNVSCPLPTLPFPSTFHLPITMIQNHSN